MQYPSIHRDRTHPYPAVIHPGWLESSGLPSTENYNRILYRVHVSRFVNLFPEELVIQEQTVSVRRRDAINWHVETIPVRDVRHMERIGTWVFSGLDIFGSDPDHDLRIWGLRIHHANRAFDLIKGLLLEESGAVRIPKDTTPAIRADKLAEAGIRVRAITE